MTKLEIMKINQSNYEKCLKEIPSLKGLERLVAENLILAWIKGNKWMGVYRTAKPITSMKKSWIWVILLMKSMMNLTSKRISISEVIRRKI